MNYELLERLRDSGFPLEPVQVEVGKEIVLQRPAVVFPARGGAGDPGIYYVPLLSDLVDACGSQLQNMSRVAGGWECNRKQRGATLDEALAELWLTQRTGAAAARR